MSTAAPALTKHQLETLLIEMCWKDPEFKQQVIANPKDLFEKFLGQKLPADLKIYIHEEDRSTIHFAVPPAPQTATELSDEELEKVAGGTEMFIVYSIALGVTIAVSAIASTGATLGSSPGW